MSFLTTFLNYRCPVIITVLYIFRIAVLWLPILKRKNILIIPENCIIRKKYIYQYHIFLHVKQTKLWLRNLKKNWWCDVEKVCLELEKEVGIRRVSKSAILINRAGHAYLYFQRVSVTAVSLTRWRKWYRSSTDPQHWFTG